MATRLYSSATAPPISPTPASGWEDTASIGRRLLTITAANADDTTITAPQPSGSGVANDDVLSYQLIYGPIAAQTISGNVKGQIGAREASGLTDARVQLTIRIIGSDGSTVRGTSLAMDTAALANEFLIQAAANPRQNRKAPRGGSTALSSVSAQAGDYIVIELGFRNHGTNTGAVRPRMGGSTATLDMPEDETTDVSDATGYRGWFEFSNTIAPLTAPAAGNAAGIGVANNPKVTIKPTAGNAGGTGAAYNPTISLVAPPRSATIDGVDFTDELQLASFSLTECANRGEVGTGGVDVFDDVSALDIPALKAFQFIEPAAGSSNKRVHTGFTHERNMQHLQDGAQAARMWAVEVTDLNILASDYVLTDVEGADRPAETDYVRVAWLLTSRLNSEAGVAVGVVPNANTVTMEATDYRGRKAADVLAECSEAAQKLWFIYDYGAGRKLYYDLATGTSLSSSAFISDLDADTDGSTVFAAQPGVTVKRSPDRIFSKVHLTYTGGTVSVSNAGTATGYRTKEAAILDASITDVTLATAKANALLAGAATELVEVEGLSIVVTGAHVNDIRAGQRVQVKLARLGISAYTYLRCTKRTIEPLGGPDPVTNVARYQVTFDVASDVLATAVGARGGDQIWPQKSNANDDGATVIVDRAGINIIDGALTLVDAFGTTVMQASGFAGTWGDFIRLGLYNARFTAADTTGIAVGRTSDLPYWTVSFTASGALIGITSNGIKTTFGALNDASSIVSDDVPVRPGSMMEAGLSYLSNRAAGTLTLNGFVKWYQADGSASSTPSTTFCNEVQTASVSSLKWVLDSVVVPSDAVTAHLKIDVTETGTHNAANYVSVYGVKLVDQPVAIPGGIQFADTGITNVSVSGTSDDYDPGSIDTISMLRASCSAAWTLRGLVVPVAKWRAIWLHNYSFFTITIKHDNAGSVVANRFYTPGSVDFVLASMAGCLLVYNISASRWTIHS